MSPIAESILKFRRDALAGGRSPEERFVMDIDPNDLEALMMEFQCPWQTAATGRLQIFGVELRPKINLRP